MKTIYLHIGIGKTGTSAIQQGLYNNRKKLYEAGFYFPVTGLAENNVGHHRLADFQADEPSRAVLQLYDELKKEIIGSCCNNVIISSEQYCYCKPAYIDFLKDFSERLGFKLKIILVVREQVSLIESTFLLWQSQGYDYRYNIYDFYKMAKGGFNYVWMINKWSDLFSDSAIVFKVYDRANLNSGILKYFMDGVTDIAEMVEPDKNVNPSLSPLFSPILSYLDRKYPYLILDSDFSQLRAELVSLLLKYSGSNMTKLDFQQAMIEKDALLVNKLLDYEAQDIDLKKLENEVALDFMGKKILISEDFKAEILEYFKDSNAEICKRFLTGEQVKIFMKNYY